MTWPSSARRRATRSSRAARSTTMRREISTRYVDTRRYWCCKVMLGSCAECPGLTMSAPVLPLCSGLAVCARGLVVYGHLISTVLHRSYQQLCHPMSPQCINNTALHPFNCQLPANTRKVHALSHITTLHCLPSTASPPLPPLHCPVLTSTGGA